MADLRSSAHLSSSTILTGRKLLSLSGIIGVTIFSTIGEILNTVGAAGLILALALVGGTAICVMECLSEMIVLWPVPNALVEYVSRFVDHDLGIVVGIAYWYEITLYCVKAVADNCAGIPGALYLQAS